MMNQKQLELGLAGGNRNRCPRVIARKSPGSRAHWWFQQMRQVVDRAFEPAPNLRGEQTLLINSQHR